MTPISATTGGLAVYEVQVTPGQQLSVGDAVKPGKDGRLVKAYDGDAPLGAVLAGVTFDPGDFKIELSPDGTLKVWDEVDLETGYGGRA